MGEIIIVAEKDGGILQFIFCVLFQFQTGRISLQVLKILGDAVGLIYGYRGGIIVWGGPQEGFSVPIALFSLY